MEGKSAKLSKGSLPLHSGQLRVCFVDKNILFNIKAHSMSKCWFGGISNENEQKKNIL